MKTKDMKALKAGEFIEHKHFGLCLVREVIENETSFWALVISPLEVYGIVRLRECSGCINGNNTLEDRCRLITKKVDNPKIPLLIFKNEYFEVHKWVEGKLGHCENGAFATEKLADFETIEEAKEFVHLDSTNNSVSVPKMVQVHLGRTQRSLHNEDFNEATYKKLLKTVAGKQEVCFVRGDGAREYGYISSENNRGVFVKFSHTLLGFLYTEDAWEATTSKLCDRSQIEFVTPDSHA